ncbi:histidine kinase dimerization/phospho-acceptor domain-containing protein [Lentimicrobium sp. S6]|uniref:histidine kinase dimerization/phospho-acceptor domain-containing protein n=1 Tax=Lentimicrobium sp. S6 TaxID=2735872 RepID=UPI0015543181|nr:histidine kinase dimerization/phospho-acceptor domain-containing protein [Lentimicrobium sp. S6]NPD45052.1 PAS domain S-box protein [Lentimicrobium sp. S6]
MDIVNIYQVAVLAVQGLLVSTLILFLFRMRSVLGIGFLYAAIGMFQFLQVYLASTVQINITDSIIVSPGSTVLFMVSLFAILLIYIKEDAAETRKIIYALLATNIAMVILLQSFKWSVDSESGEQLFKVSTQLFDTNILVLLVGTVTLFVDSFLLIILYEFISKRVKWIFFKVLLTTLIVASFDTICFSLLAFGSSEYLSSIIYSNLISKSVATLFYSIIFSVYLFYIERGVDDNPDYKFNDIFHTLSYRQKFEIEKTQKDNIKKNAEQAIRMSKVRYETLARISPVGIFLSDIEGKTVYVNPKWCSISGILEEDALGDGWLKTVHPADIGMINDNWNAAQDLNVNSHIEYRFIHEDGSVVWVLGQAVPELDADNNKIGYIGTITNITKLKQYEKEQILLKEKAQESDRLKSAFLANMSHEIRTPMNGILGFSELLKEPDLEELERKEYISVIERSGMRMLNIINDIVDISKIESGLMKVYLEEVNINEIVQFIYDFFKPETERKNVALELYKPLHDSEVIIPTDKEKVIGILTNLVKNAIKHTQEGSIEFGYVRKEIGESSFMEFFVKDTGSGVPDDKREAIFDRFIQAEMENNRTIEGTGLGLPISKAYVEMLGGKIWLDDIQTDKTVFYFTLPFQI